MAPHNETRFEIRPATPADLPTILALVRGLAEYEKLEHMLVATEEQFDKWLFQEKKIEIVLGWENDSPVGFAMFFTSFSSFLGLPGIYLEDLFVVPEKRGRGYGKKLLQFLAGEVVSRGYGRLEWACLNWNQPSIDFYLKAGAERMGEWNTYRLAGDALAGFAGKK